MILITDLFPEYDIDSYHDYNRFSEWVCHGCGAKIDKDFLEEHVEFHEKVQEARERAFYQPEIDG